MSRVSGSSLRRRQNVSPLSPGIATSSTIASGRSISISRRGRARVGGLADLDVRKLERRPEQLPYSFVVVDQQELQGGLSPLRR